MVLSDGRYNALNWLWGKGVCRFCSGIQLHRELSDRLQRMKADWDGFGGGGKRIHRGMRSDSL